MRFHKHIIARLAFEERSGRFVSDVFEKCGRRAKTLQPTW